MSRACPSCRSTNVIVPTTSQGNPLGCLIALLSIPALLLLIVVVQAIIAGVTTVVREVTDAFTGRFAPLYILAVVLVIGAAIWLAVARYRAKQRAKELALLELARSREYEQQEAARAHAEQLAEHQRRAALEAQRIEEHRQSLIARFGLEAAAKIEAKELWIGATKDMVVAALGSPADVTEKVLKTKTKTVLKYYRNGAKYGLKVNLENDAVVGWEK